MPGDEFLDKARVSNHSQEETPVPVPEIEQQPRLSTSAGPGAESNTVGQKEESTGEPAPSSLVPLPSQTSDFERDALIEQARAFLRSPHVAHEPLDRKHRFLLQKGLHESEIENLLCEIPPTIPPRTYPQPPPSNLPNMLLGLARIFTWLTGGSAILLFIYYKFLLPRLTQSALARRALKQHQTNLLMRLNESLRSLKASQAEAFSVLPPPIRSYEAPSMAEKHSLESLELDPNSRIRVPAFTVLRCALEGFATSGEQPIRDELFWYMREKVPWLTTEEGAEFETKLWEVLNLNECFSESESKGRRVWTYTPPTPELHVPTPLIAALSSLKCAFPFPEERDVLRNGQGRYHHTFQTLADFVGYITTQIYYFGESIGRSSAYAMRHPALELGHGAVGGNTRDSRSSSVDVQQEEIRKEIRTLKGLVLNRRTFVPSGNRSTPFAALPSTQTYQA